MAKILTKLKKSGFTIIELLVVVSVIGILSAILAVSYGSVSNSARVASVKSDLENAFEAITVFHVQNKVYPTSVTGESCPNPTSSELCLKSSGDNTYHNYVFDNNANTFSIESWNGDTKFWIAHDYAPPQVVEESPAIFGSGGNISEGGGYRVHSFGSNATVEVTTSGSVEVTVNGAGGGGGGGGGESATGGAAGGDSIFTNFTSGVSYTAYGGGGGGGAGSNYNPPSDGSNGNVGIPGGFTNTASPSIGGGANGGDGGPSLEDWCNADYGGTGGNGGKVSGTISVTAGQIIHIFVGQGGSGGAGANANDCSQSNGGEAGTVGGNGVVTIRYPYSN